MITEWHIGKKNELRCVKSKDGEPEYTSVRYEGTAKGYNTHTVKITKCENGALTFSEQGGGEGFIYLYPEQVKHLRTILAAKDSKLRRQK